MVIGIGNDLIEIERFEKSSDRQGFLERYFTENELAQAKGRAKMLAADFSVKESVSKVFGTGIVGFSLDEIEVMREESGRPYVNLYGKALEIARSKGIRRIHVSITDTQTLVMTVAIGED